MGEDRFKNQRRLIDGDVIAKTKFVVVGAGAIGSFTVASLSKMGAREIIVYDNDTLEDHNFSNQMYPVYHIGKPKVEALESVAFSYGEARITPRNERWNHDTAIDGDVIIVAVDNMDVRKAIWDWYKNRPHKFFVEARMAAQVFHVYGIEAEDKAGREYYETTLYPQKEAMPDRCGEKSIIYTVLQVSGQVCSQIKRFLMNEIRPTGIVYDCFNDNVTKKFTKEAKYEIVEAAEEPVGASENV